MQLMKGCTQIAKLENSIPHAMKVILRAEIKDLLELGFLSMSSSG